jgi:hypothetical protein
LAKPSRRDRDKEALPAPKRFDHRQNAALKEGQGPRRHLSTGGGEGRKAAIPKERKGGSAIELLQCLCKFTFGLSRLADRVQSGQIRSRLAELEPRLLQLNTERRHFRRPSPDLSEIALVVMKGIIGFSH